MNIDVKVENNILMIKIEGEFDLYASPLLNEKVSKVNFEDIIGIIIDFSEVEYIDSSGLGTIVGLKKKMGISEKKLFITNANDSIKKIIKLTHLESIINIAVSIREAVNNI